MNSKPQTEEAKGETKPYRQLDPNTIHFRPGSWAEIRTHI